MRCVSFTRLYCADTASRNAQELIDAFWVRHKQKARKSITKGQGRKSVSASATGSSKKRRKSVENDEMEDEPPAKKAQSRKSVNSRAKSESVDVTEDMIVDGGDSQDIVSMQQVREYKDLESWEHIVERVDTVEQDKQANDLMIYFTLSVQHSLTCFIS